MARQEKRLAEGLREVKIITGVNPYAEGSAEVSFGKTKVLVTATVEKELPKWMAPGDGGWITAEYGMLPRSTHTRNKREAAQGKQGGRTLEIQRLVARALRQAVDIKKLEGLTIRIDCDVLCADGGTRTASISGAWVALFQAIESAMKQGLLSSDITLKQVAAVSVGQVKGELLVDLCYEEDSGADFDLNVVCDEDLKIIEIQGTGERATLSLDEVNKLVLLSQPAIRKIMQIQKQAVRPS
ncbi:MAG: ribonuclease PH [Deltaproteobacteria bacterium]|nr:ribonuclease PH [Deltaproteobacteria bacterium]